MDDNYFIEHVPLWKGGSKSFEVLADATSGRIPVTRIEDWRDLDKLVRSGFYGGRNMIFRGQRRHDWKLEPTLARVSENGLISERLAASQLELFKSAVRGRIKDYGLVEEGAEDELWSVGQHHGLDTPLLDWTHSPYVALFFAFFKEDSKYEGDNLYRVVYALDKSFVSDDDVCPNLRLVEPKRDDHGRLVNQAGLFTFSPYDSTIENELANALADESFPDDDLRVASEEEQAAILSKYLCKIYIRNEERDACLQHLRRMNVHHASLFPDLIGASEHCNLLIAEQEREYQVSVAADELSKRLAKLDDEEASHADLDGLLVPAGAALDKGHYQQILSQFLNGVEFDQAKLAIIADQIKSAVEGHQVVDWDRRESALARMRNVMRLVLRKYDYPREARDSVVAAIEQCALDVARS